MQLSLLGGLLTDNMAKCCADKAASAIQLASSARTGRPEQSVAFRSR
ncbi:Uncharacterised protein [Mycobacteroides abscessus subsp. bolletii]|nr:Uncharacterised protein [Mycobacteroides abscessus]SKG97961.1 Uncharacterised protein [Mycobacteroides abscessus subsp. bolletii]CPS14341.1 Uncharacterised protein [Mycobacteroides abscessus]CPS16720.1 Uncharacterised protein [Mycobacteroides abscessus]CPS87816.1 Uncharacterised protein [Mycobacteroides abscessus]